MSWATIVLHPDGNVCGGTSAPGSAFPRSWNPPHARLVWCSVCRRIGIVPETPLRLLSTGGSMTAATIPHTELGPVIAVRIQSSCQASLVDTSTQDVAWTCGHFHTTALGARACASRERKRRETGVCLHCSTGLHEACEYLAEAEGGRGCTCPAAIHQREGGPR